MKFKSASASRTFSNCDTSCNPDPVPEIPDANQQIHRNYHSGVFFFFCFGRKRDNRAWLYLINMANKTWSHDFWLLMKAKYNQLLASVSAHLTRTVGIVRRATGDPLLKKGALINHV